MPLLFFFVVWGFLELFTIISVASAIGALPTIGLIILSAILGSFLIRRQQAIFASHVQRVQSGVVASLDEAEMREGMYGLLAGVLLILPGFISDVFALCMLLRPLRKLFGGVLLRAFKPDVVARRFGWEGVPHNVYEHDGSVQAKREDGTSIHGELLDSDDNHKMR